MTCSIVEVKNFQELVDVIICGDRVDHLDEIMKDYTLCNKKKIFSFANIRKVCCVSVKSSFKVRSKVKISSFWPYAPPRNSGDMNGAEPMRVCWLNGSTTRAIPISSILHVQCWLTKILSDRMTRWIVIRNLFDAEIFYLCLWVYVTQQLLHCFRLWKSNAIPKHFWPPYVNDAKRRNMMTEKSYIYLEVVDRNWSMSLKE